jgi:hypothetical protein
MNIVPRQFPPIPNRALAIDRAANGRRVGAYELSLLEQATYWQIAYGMPSVPAQLLELPITNAGLTVNVPFVMPQLAFNLLVSIVTRHHESNEGMARVYYLVEDGWSGLQSSNYEHDQGEDYHTTEIVIQTSDGLTVNTPSLAFLNLSCSSSLDDLAVLHSVSVVFLPLTPQFGVQGV